MTGIDPTVLASAVVSDATVILGAVVVIAAAAYRLWRVKHHGELDDE